VVKKEASVYARVTNIKFSSAVGTELIRVAQVLTDLNASEGIIRS
jgi:hypothetical protein